MSSVTQNNAASVMLPSQRVARSLRLRAEARLRKRLAALDKTGSTNAEQELNELRINQIEIELLSEEFSRLRRKISNKCLAHYEQEASQFSYYFLGRDGRILDAQRHACATGSLGDYVQPAQRERFRQFLVEVFESNAIKTGAFSFVPPGRRKKSCARLPQHASIEAVVDDSRQYCLAVLEDITAIKYAEEREKVSNAALAMLDKTIAASRNEIFVLDAATLRFTFANQRALENLGYTMEELSSLDAGDIQTPVSASETHEVIAFVASHRKSTKKLKAVYKRKNGSLYPVEMYLQYFEHDAARHVIVIALDTSSQYAIESKLKSIVESAGAIIWATDTNFELTFVSDQIQDILGYVPQQLIGYSLSDLFDASFFHEYDWAQIKDGLDRVTSDGVKIFNQTCRAKHVDGTWRWLNVNMTPVRALDGQVSQVVGVMHDIHAQKQAEEDLRQLNLLLDNRVHEEIKKNSEKDFLLRRQAGLAAMGEMIGNIAHQWRQPINSLGLIISDLEDAAIYGECDLKYIQTAAGKTKKIIQKMSSTIDDFRHFFRADKNIETFSLAKVTGECLNLLDASLRNNNITVILNEEHEVFVSGYANEYSQAVLNILSNAKDAIAGRKGVAGKIVVEIGEDGDYGVHSIIDNGGGIPADVMHRIFEPHFTTKEQGVGIGLYMALVTVEKNMKGKISVENVGEGAKFSLYLPKTRKGGPIVSH